MAFNKSKALENALKFLNQGKVSQAISEYQQILRHDAKDQATLMTVGDLFARQGDMKQAVEYFERLAQVYLNDGFNSKAIAIYKKIAKLAPAELAPLERLADLYVQQGVLSEARPLFLQIAEAHLKANRAQKAVEVLHRLLEVEPENPRVQMRLAELYNVMGQKKEAAQTYYNYARRLYDRNEGDEAQKLIERALEVDSSNPAALLLKAKILALTGKIEAAIAILEKHPEADAGGDVTNLLVDLDLKTGRNESAADRARNQLVRGSSHSGLLLRVCDSLSESGNAAEALPLLGELRDPMIEIGEQDKFLGALTKVCTKLPGQIEPLEIMADFCRHTSDPFHLTAALNQLVDLYAAAGNQQQAEESMLELIERSKGDERLVARLRKLRGQEGEPTAAPEAERIWPETPERAEERPTQGQELREQAEATARITPTVVEEPLDEETRSYIAQALTDVDLFSSYGLVKKAAQLLEIALERAPRHTPTLERLLDLQLGAGDERRTAELAAQLEQIHRERGDTVNADRFAELRQRFQRLAGLSAEQLPLAPAPAPAPQEHIAPEPVATEEFAAVAEAAPLPSVEAEAATIVEFEIPAAVVDLDPLPAVEEVAPQVLEAPQAPQAAQAPAPSQTPMPMPAEEVDLSDEWEAMVQEVIELPPVVGLEQAVDLSAEQTPGQQAAETQAEQAPPSEEAVPAEAPAVEASAPVDAEGVEIESEPLIEIIEEEAEPALALAPLDEAVAPAEFELELTPAPAGKNGAVTTEDFLAELAAEVEDMESPAASELQAASSIAKDSLEAALEAATESAPEPLPEHLHVGTLESRSVSESAAENLNELAEVFKEFRSELGEIADEDEDLETHYNLGIAYREMGLLDEAIGEFQKVAKAIQKGRPFRYAMNCATLLALSFMDKGEGKIASLWYQKALNTPGIDQEAVLALRYDLGVALESAGESPAALDSFRQVYALNIDYRDVADRIAELQKV